MVTPLKLKISQNVIKGGSLNGINTTDSSIEILAYNITAQTTINDNLRLYLTTGIKNYHEDENGTIEFDYTSISSYRYQIIPKSANTWQAHDRVILLPGSSNNVVVDKTYTAGKTPFDTGTQNTTGTYTKHVVVKAGQTFELNDKILRYENLASLSTFDNIIEFTVSGVQNTNPPKYTPWSIRLSGKDTSLNSLSNGAVMIRKNNQIVTLPKEDYATDKYENQGNSQIRISGKNLQQSKIGN